MFSHEKLHVYGRALDFAAQATVLSSSWEKKPSVVDHFLRASESVVLNLGPAQNLAPAFRPVDKAATSVILNVAEGNGRYAELDHQRFLEMAQSSAVKAAAHLDLCVVKKLLTQADMTSGKELLKENWGDAGENVNVSGGRFRTFFVNLIENFVESPRRKTFTIKFTTKTLWLL